MLAQLAAKLRSGAHHTLVIPARSALSLLEFEVHRSAHLARDRVSLQELNTGAAQLPLPRGLELQWLGTAGFRLEYQGYCLLIDPYLTRAPLGNVLSRTALASDRARTLSTLRRADAVVVGHTHFDHALDVPLIAREFGCRVYGSHSLRALMALHGETERAVEVVPHRVYALGPFEVTFIPSLHAKLALGLAVPAGGELTCDHLDGLWAGAYHCGSVYGIHIAVAGTTFYHQGSANLVDEEILCKGVEFFLCGIAGRGFTERYLPRILARLRPHVVIPHHFDDFFRPAEQPSFSLNVNLTSFVDELAAVSREPTIAALLPMQTIAGPKAC